MALPIRPAAARQVRSGGEEAMKEKVRKKMMTGSSGQSSLPSSERARRVGLSSVDQKIINVQREITKSQLSALKKMMIK